MCLKVEAKNAPFRHKRCPKCGETVYCSVQCRKKHWPTHRTRCRLAVLESGWDGGDAHLQPLPPKGHYHPPASYVPPGGWGQATMEVRRKDSSTSRTGRGAGGGKAKAKGGGWEPPGGGWGQATMAKAPRMPLALVSSSPPSTVVNVTASSSTPVPPSGTTGTNY